jgi:hypothetical protein
MLDKLASDGVKVIKLDTEKIDLANNTDHQQQAAQFIRENTIEIDQSPTYSEFGEIHILR